MYENFIGKLVRVLLGCGEFEGVLTKCFGGFYLEGCNGVFSKPNCAFSEKAILDIKEIA